MSSFNYVIYLTGCRLFLIIGCFVLLNTCLCAQNEKTKWYFGTYMAVDFMTSPPTPIFSSTMNAVEGCASVADSFGNLLFYTDGTKIWNNMNAVMAGGAALSGNFSTTQGALIVKQPGSSSIYYVFSLGGFGWGNLYYSIVDMNLAVGLGSVTVSNILLSTGCTEKLTGVKHCNGNDYWVLCASSTTGDLSAFLVTAAGVNTVPVVSSVPGLFVRIPGQMKTSPNGKRIAFANLGYFNASVDLVQVCDFDNSTGVATNAITISNIRIPYGVEFSPDGTKLYANGVTLSGNFISGVRLLQWDLCAGSPTAIAASTYTIPDGGSQYAYGSLQVAADGKIYMAKLGERNLSVINNPNNAGAACNYSNASVFSFPPNSQYYSAYGLPNFITSDLSPPPGYTYSLGDLNSCSSASFISEATLNYPSNICAATFSNSPTGVLWDFGDPLSGVANTSTLTAPTHIFSNAGTYTVSLIDYNSNFCTGANDTIRKIITIPFCVSLSSQSITCANLGSATVTPQNGLGPFNYTWMPTGQTSSVATGLNPGTYTLVVDDVGTGLTYTNTTVFLPPPVLAGTITNSPYQPCASVNTGTASILLSGGSGAQNYTWTGPTGVQTNSLATGLGAGNYTVTVVDEITFCSLTDTFVIGPPPSALSVAFSPGSPSVCVGSSVILSAMASGGTPILPLGYTYSWTSGPSTNSYLAVPTITGNSIYTVTIEDGNHCTLSFTVPVNVVTNPILTVFGAEVCYGSPAVISASGAATYVWSGPNGFSATTAQAAIPLANNIMPVVYYVLGTGLNTCTTLATAEVSTLPLPVAQASLTARACVNGVAHFVGTGGISYAWQGPFNFSASLQNFSATIGNPGMAGIYTLVVTDENGCKGSTTANLIVDPAPQGGLWSSNPQRCVPFCSDFKLASTTSISGTSWDINGQTFTADPFNYCFTSPGDYRLIGSFTDYNGCKSTIPFIISAYPLPNADFTYQPEQPIENEEMQFTSTSIGPDLKNWSWYFGTNTEYRNSYSAASHLFPDAGIYPVALVIKNKWGCEDTVVKAITVAEDFQLFVPNAFTPNADAINETFLVVGRGVKMFSMLVYDRWGEKLFEGNDISRGWDGRFKGEDCKSDVYIWKIRVTGFNGKEKTMTGSVLLYR